MSRSRSNKRKVTVALLGALFCGIGGNLASAQDVVVTSPAAPVSPTPMVLRTEPKSSLSAGNLIGAATALGAVGTAIDYAMRGDKSLLGGALNKFNGNANGQIQELQKQNEQIQKQLAEKERNLNDLNQKIQQQENNNTDDQELQESKKQLIKQQKEMAELRKQLDETNKKIAEEKKLQQEQEKQRKWEEQRKEEERKWAEQRKEEERKNEEDKKIKELEQKLSQEQKENEKNLKKKEEELKKLKEQNGTEETGVLSRFFSKKKAVDPKSIKKIADLEQEIAVLKEQKKKDIAVLKEQKKNAEAKNPGLLSNLFNKGKKAYVEHKLKNLDEKNVELEKKLKEYKDKEEQQKAELREKDNECAKNINDSLNLIKGRIHDSLGGGVVHNIVHADDDDTSIGTVVRNATAFFTKAVKEKRIPENESTKPFFEVACGKRKLISFGLNYLRTDNTNLNNEHSTNLLYHNNNLCVMNTITNVGVNGDNAKTSLTYNYQVGYGLGDDKKFSFRIVQNNSNDLKVKWEAYGYKLNNISRGEFTLYHNNLKDMEFFDLKPAPEPSDYNFVPLPGGSKWANTKAIGKNIGKAIWGTTKKIGRGIGKGGKLLGYKAYDAIQKKRDNDKAERNINQRNIISDSEKACAIADYNNEHGLFGYGVVNNNDF